MQWRKIISLLPLWANTKLQLQIKKNPTKMEGRQTHHMLMCQLRPH